MPARADFRFRPLLEKTAPGDAHHFAGEQGRESVGVGGEQRFAAAGDRQLPEEFRVRRPGVAHRHHGQADALPAEIGSEVEAAVLFLGVVGVGEEDDVAVRDVRFFQFPRRRLESGPAEDSAALRLNPESRLRQGLGGVDDGEGNHDVGGRVDCDKGGLVDVVEEADGFGGADVRQIHFSQAAAGRHRHRSGPVEGERHGHGAATGDAPEFQFDGKQWIED